MGVAASRVPGGDGATVVTSQKVREGRVDAYKRWQEKTNHVAEGFDGFEGAEVYPPGSGEENEWVAVFRFSRVDELTTWLDSGARRELLNEARPLFEGAPTQEVLAGGAPAPREQEAVTAVISHSVRPGKEPDFVRWQDKVRKVQEKHPGFMGTELFQPVEGIQDKWVVAFRFDTRDNLDDWLASADREKLLEEGHQYFSSYDVRKIGSAFSGWFRFGEGDEEGIPSNWKQAMSVVLALYPTVVVLNLTVGKVFAGWGIPGYLSLFLSNVLSVSILTWVLMPLVNRALTFWLLPDRARSVRTNAAGALVVMVCWAIFLLIFGLTTG
ncbi:antibiotic biosynthesis monooxygenase [Streptomyces sp. NPDC002730]|uniref:antibiotic biosynthesis monooxygenase n=1 Tax=Streptomyces sp. NPDC002730 TaxID=3364662 RepID=UPI00368C757A